MNMTRQLQLAWVLILATTSTTTTHTKNNVLAFAPRNVPNGIIRSTTVGVRVPVGGVSSSHLKSSNQDLSGGIFFDGPTDFKRIDPMSKLEYPSSSSSSSSSIQPASQSKSQPPQKQTQKNNKHNKNNSINTIPKDVVIIGAGLAGLSIALHITLNSNRQVTIIEKEDPIQQMKKTAAASFAAAGMLAPHSERLPSGPLLDLCLQSREMYTDFVSTIESITANCNSDASKYLWGRENEDTSGLEPWEVGFAATGGFLAPAFAGDSVATWSPPSQVQSTAMWLDDIQVHEMEPSLHPNVVGGWWFPEDASVDARRLTCALRAACIQRGVQFMWGEGSGAGSLDLGGGKCKGIRLDDGRILSADSVVVANGSWMRNLLPVPVTPHKGQSFSLRMPPNTEPILSRILFAQDTYIVPKADGRIVVGATVEVGTFDSDVTPYGMMHCMSNALQLVPGLSDLPVEESWAGLRPTTPDKGPILGRTSWDNLFLAGGYWRNGVLLAPKTGQLIADLVINNGQTLPDEEDEQLITAFNWDRFTSKDGGQVLAANTRYAASMHPVHKRASGAGIAAAVGTELGFYSGADAAKEERKKDRGSLFQDGGKMTNDEESAFERAARMGMSDATAFGSFGESIEKPRSKKVPSDDDDDDDDDDNDEIIQPSDAQSFDGSPDALTVGYASSSTDDESTTTTTTTSKNENDNDGKNDLESIYKKIQENKAQSTEGGVTMSESSEDERTDPGFRVFHVEKETRTVREVPPYTSPQNMMAQIENEKPSSADVEQAEQNVQEEEEEEVVPDEKHESTSDYDETTFDGYQTIQNANSNESRGKELAAMKIARMANRLDTSEIKESDIGVLKEDDVTTVNRFKQEKKESSSNMQQNTQLPNEESEYESPSDYDETTFDGYQTIQSANSNESRVKELEAMKIARMANRIDTSEIKESDIGVLQNDGPTCTSESPKNNSANDDLSNIYDQIRSNKESIAKDIKMEDSIIEDRPDPGFRVFHVDKDTREETEIPPYTSPGEFLKSIENEKAKIINEE